MKKGLIKKINAYQRIRRVFSENPLVTDNHPVLKTLEMEFGSRLSAITGTQVPGRKSTLPVTESKNDRFVYTALRVDVEANALLLYAEDQGDPSLAIDVPTSYSELTEGSETLQVQRFWKVHDAAKRAGAALVPYGVTAALLAELDTLLPELEAMIGAPRSGIDRRILKRMQLEEAFEAMDDFLLNRLDRAVRTCRLSHEAFTEAYFLARKLHDTATRSAAEQTGTALPTGSNRMASLPSTEELASALKETSTNGAGVLNGAH